ncbi:MAG: hypothetical protein IJ051_07065 [Clostridia bacterium]|nr:hypothetical protein [Clostridia bacterium]
MKKLLNLCVKLVCIAVGLFVGTFAIYFFNLDMKLLAFLEPYLDKVYDLRERHPKV